MLWARHPRRLGEPLTRAPLPLLHHARIVRLTHGLACCRKEIKPAQSSDNYPDGIDAAPDVVLSGMLEARVGVTDLVCASRISAGGCSLDPECIWKMHSDKPAAWSGSDRSRTVRHLGSRTCPQVGKQLTLEVPPYLRNLKYQIPQVSTDEARLTAILAVAALHRTRGHGGAKLGVQQSRNPIPPTVKYKRQFWRGSPCLRSRPCLKMDKPVERSLEILQDTATEGFTVFVTAIIGIKMLHRKKIPTAWNYNWVTCQWSDVHLNHQVLSELCEQGTQDPQSPLCK